MIEVAIKCKENERPCIVDLYKNSCHSYYCHPKMIIFNFLDNQRDIVKEIEKKYSIEYLYCRDDKTKDDIKIARGDVLYVDFPYKKFNECSGKQYALVLQNNIANKTSTTTIVAEILPYRVAKEEYRLFKYPSIYIKNKEYSVILNSIRTIDKLRIIKKIDKITKKEQRDIDKELLKFIS